MEKTNRPGERQSPDRGPLATEKGMNALEPEGPGQSENSETAWSKPRPGDPINPFAEIGHRHDQQSDYGKMLLERIADVDGDMRATAVRLQRALQTHRREVDQRLRHHARLLGGLVLSALLLAIALLFLLYRQSGLESPQVAADVSEEQALRAQVRERPERVTTQTTETTAASGEPDRDDGQTQVFPATE